MSAIAMDAGRPAFNMDRWLEFTELTGMRTSETTLTEAVKAYVVSRTRFLDDTVFKFELLDFVSFLEAIARLVEMTPVPSKAALTELGVDQVSEFYERVAALKEAVDGDDEQIGKCGSPSKKCGSPGKGSAGHAGSPPRGCETRTRAPSGGKGVASLLSRHRVDGSPVELATLTENAELSNQI